jgi:hypothetical protein
VRIRIALSTAVAVIISTGAFFMLLGNNPDASAGNTSRSLHTTPHHTLSNTQLAFFHIPSTVKSVPGAGLNLGGRAPTPAQVAPQPAQRAAVAVPQTDANSVYTANWACIRMRESGNRYNDPSAPSGAYGIIEQTWHSFGFTGWPYQAAPVVQDSLALRLYNMYGWQPWSSRYSCGL